jgi:tetratricopeptide (TPR) repeat protein
MSSISELLQQIPDRDLSTEERVRLRCQLAKQFEKDGNYEAACRVLGNLWTGFGKYPNLEMLDKRTSAEVLLRVGVLTGLIGSMRLIKGSQQLAEKFISESIAIFESLPDMKKVAEAQTEIALCCTRSGALERARAFYAKALSHLDDGDGDLKAIAILRSAGLELFASRLKDALSLLESGAALFEASTNHVLRGSFHNEMARALKNLGVAENRPDYIDRALNEYGAAVFHLEQAGHARYQGIAENNIAMLLLQRGRFAEAHTHLDRAQALHTCIADGALLATLEETRARVLLAEGKFAQAERVAVRAIQIFEKGDERPQLAEALTTHGVSLVHLHRIDDARAAFARAIEVATQAGDFEKAGLAALSLIEQLAEELPADELSATIEFASTSLRETQNAGTRNRLTECAYRALSVIHTARPDWSNFSLDETLRRHEGRFVEMALEDSGGSVTKAAELLGLPGHQSLNFILNRRHPHLLAVRTPVKPRRRSIIKG